MFMIKILPITILFLATITNTILAADRVELLPYAKYESGIFNKSAAEIVVFNKNNKQFYVVNGAAPSIDIFTLKDKTTVSLPPLRLKKSESPTSVTTFGKLIAVAVYNPEIKDRAGKVILFSLNHNRIAEFTAGSLPDMLSFSPHGKTLLVANEGEAGKQINPEGSLTLIRVNHDRPAESIVKQLKFTKFNTKKLRIKGVRISPNLSFAKDAEPEYVAYSKNGEKAWVSLQENNALAEVNIMEAEISKILPLGVKDHNIEGQGIDPKDHDGINIITVPVKGMYMPDAIAVMTYEGNSFILTANEGDAREEEIKASLANIDKGSLTKAQITSLGNLRISSTDGDTDHDGDIDVPHSYGARSFSIFSHDGNRIYDSGDIFEKITAMKLGNFFNSDNKSSKGDKRSDNKGPEPEGITIGQIGNQAYAFIALERVGGVMVFNVTNPYSPEYNSYYVSRTFNKDFNFNSVKDRNNAGPLGPEGVTFISAKDSPTGLPLLLVANEVSGSVEILQINNL